MTYVSWILSHKLLCFLVVTASAFGIATIVLGVENTGLKEKINELENQNNSGAATVSNMSKYLLPTTVKPKLYDLYLYPDLATGLFKGTLRLYIYSISYNIST